MPERGGARCAALCPGGNQTRLSIGYQLPNEDDSTVAIVGDFRVHVAEVYFAAAGYPSGRWPLGMVAGTVDGGAQEVLEWDLAELSRMGVGLVLLLNAACYGADSVSAAFAGRIRALIEGLQDKCALTAVAIACRADVLLADDSEAREVARRNGIKVAGFIGIVERAAGEELVNLPEVFERLKQTKFRISERLLQDALDRWRGGENARIENGGGLS